MTLTDEFIKGCRQFFDNIDMVYDETMKRSAAHGIHMTKEEAKHVVNKKIDDMVKFQLKKMPTDVHKKWLASIMELTRKT